MEVAEDEKIAEADSEGSSSEKSDATSSSSDSSIEAALNGDVETEDMIYDRILAAQESKGTEDQ